MVWYYCKLGKVNVPIIWRPDGVPICFYSIDGAVSKCGNVCNENDDNFEEPRGEICGKGGGKMR